MINCDQEKIFYYNKIFLYLQLVICMAALMGGFSHIGSMKPLQCIFLSCILVKNNFSKQEFKKWSPYKEQCCDGCI